MYLEGETIMQLTTVKELFKERDKYLNQEITGRRLDPQHP